MLLSRQIEVAHAEKGAGAFARRRANLSLFVCKRLFDSFEDARSSEVVKMLLYLLCLLYLPASLMSSEYICFLSQDKKDVLML